MLMALLLIGCSKPRMTPLRETAAFEPVDDGDRASLIASVERQFEALKKIPDDRPYLYGKTTVGKDRVLRTLQRFLELARTTASDEEMRSAVQREFLFFQSVGNSKGKVLFTGYYEPLIQASPVKTEHFRFPLHARPADLIGFSSDIEDCGRILEGKRSTYFPRSQIDGPPFVLEGKGYDLCYVADYFDKFTLQVQGSGAVQMPDGVIKRVNFATTNCIPYVSVGKVMIQGGAIPAEKMSLQAMRTYFQQNPDKLYPYIFQNERYVFFTFGDKGPYGYENALLTPGRSIATDRRIRLPKGTLAYIDTQKPVNTGGGDPGFQPFKRYVMDQDTGNIIIGPGRVDVYWGPGEEAEYTAGHMKTGGALYYLLLKEE